MELETVDITVGGTEIKYDVVCCTIDVLIIDDNLPRVPDVVSALSTQTAIIITWSFTTILDSKNETFIVMYGTTPGNLSMASRPVMSVVDESRQNYSVLIMDLLPGTEYYYQINSTNIFESFTNEECNIRTMDASEF